jgi:hypothetical protein
LFGLTRGFQTLGDDYILIEDLDDEFNAHAIYRTIKSFPSSILNLPEKFLHLERHTIEHTGKYVYICSRSEGVNLFTNSSRVIKIFGLHLQKNILLGESDVMDFDSRYISLSSIEQIPAWVDKSSKFSQKLFNKVQHTFQSSAEGLETLKKNMASIDECFEGS